MDSGFAGSGAWGSGAAGNWPQELLEAYTSVGELRDAGLVDEAEAARLAVVGERFRIRLPRSYAALIDRSPEGRARCPIRPQAIPALSETDPALPDWAVEWSLRAHARREPWSEDAIGDLARQAAPRLTHRYESRAIIHVSSTCALYCRFCFRKSLLNDAERRLYEGDLKPAVAYVAAHPEIREVILTGGDPLSLSDVALERLLTALGSIAHVRHIRVHSRMAATLPSRLTEGLAAILSQGSRPLVSLVSHFNHPRELTPVALSGLARLRRAGVPLYNQSVLLRGVNDEAETLGALFQQLFELGARPFYLHHPDWTPGTFDFRASIARGRALLRELRGRLSGPALPQYVLDLPGGGGKIPLCDAEWATCLEENRSGGIAGALYAIRRPATRAEDTAPALYLDLWKH